METTLGICLLGWVYFYAPSAGDNMRANIGHIPAFYVILVPLEYIPTIPPHSTYIIVICFVLF